MTEEKLIEAVREHRELYDTKNANYMKTKLKNRIWSDIANDLNLKDGDEAKTLWLKLRNSYRDARRRQMRCMKSGAAPENIKPWRFQQQMSFLEAVMSIGCREGNVNDSDDDSQPPSTLAVSDDLEEVSEAEGNLDEGERSQQSNTADDKSSRTITKRASDLPTTSSSPGTKRKQDDNIQSLLKRSLQQRDERGKQRAEERKKLLSQDNPTDDPLYNFFLSMYQLTKKMPNNYQHRVRTQLFHAVSKSEEEIMNIPSRPSSSLTSSHHSVVSSPYPSPNWLDSQSQMPIHHPQTQQHGNLEPLW